MSISNPKMESQNLSKKHVLYPAPSSHINNNTLQSQQQMPLPSPPKAHMPKLTSPKLYANHLPINHSHQQQSQSHQYYSLRWNNYQKYVESLQVPLEHGLVLKLYFSFFLLNHLVT